MPLRRRGRCAASRWRRGEAASNLARPTRFERATPAFGGQYSNPAELRARMYVILAIIRDSREEHMSGAHPHHDPIEDNIETHPVKLAVGIAVGAVALVIGIILMAQ